MNVRHTKNGAIFGPPCILSNAAMQCIGQTDNEVNYIKGESAPVFGRCQHYNVDGIASGCLERLVCEMIIFCAGSDVTARKALTKFKPRPKL